MGPTSRTSHQRGTSYERVRRFADSALKATKPNDACTEFVDLVPIVADDVEGVEHLAKGVAQLYERAERHSGRRCSEEQRRRNPVRDNHDVLLAD